MSFATPLMLLFLIAVPLGIAAYLLMQRRRASYAVRFTNLDLLANVVDQTPGWRRHLPMALYLLALGALVFALARPQTTIAVPKEEATVVLVMDVSGSMNAMDVDPTRLRAAQSAAKLLVDELPEKFQMALVAFANGVQTVVPITNDKDLMEDGLDRLRALGGTAMGDALVQALDLVRPPAIGDEGVLPQSPGATPTPAPSDATIDAERPAVIVLLSDGANSVGLWDPLDAAQEAQDRGVPIYTIALGTENGVVTVPDESGRLRRVAVPPDEETLAAIAELTEGQFFAAPSADDLRSVYEELGSKVGYENEDREITAAFAGGAAVLLLLGAAFSLYWFHRFP